MGLDNLRMTFFQRRTYILRI